MASDNNPSKELFGRQPVLSVKPITADMCMITWGHDNLPNGEVGPPPVGDIVTGATNITISYQQQVVRRRTLATAGGKPLAVIYPSQPQGSIQIQRLFANLGATVNGTPTNYKAGQTSDIFSYPGWNVCAGTASIAVTFNGDSAYKDCATKNPGYRMSGCIVTGYNISAEAEGLTVVDNVSIEFLQMFQQPI